MPRSKAEARLAFAIMSGKAKSSGMSKSYAQEVTSKLHSEGPGAMKSLPEHTSGSGSKGKPRYTPGRKMK